MHAPGMMAGRGRGRASTLPAWMTNPELTSTTPSLPSLSSISSTPIPSSSVPTTSCDTNTAVKSRFDISQTSAPAAMSSADVVRSIAASASATSAASRASAFAAQGSRNSSPPSHFKEKGRVASRSPDRRGGASRRSPSYRGSSRRRDSPSSSPRRSPVKSRHNSRHGSKGRSHSPVKRRSSSKPRKGSFTLSSASRSPPSRKRTRQGVKGSRSRGRGGDSVRSASSKSRSRSADDRVARRRLSGSAAANPKNSRASSKGVEIHKDGPPRSGRGRSDNRRSTSSRSSFSTSRSGSQRRRSGGRRGGSRPIDRDSRYRQNDSKSKRDASEKYRSSGGYQHNSPAPGVTRHDGRDRYPLSGGAMQHNINSRYHRDDRYGGGAAPDRWNNNNGYNNNMNRASYQRYQGGGGGSDYPYHNNQNYDNNYRSRPYYPSRRPPQDFRRGGHGPTDFSSSGHNGGRRGYGNGYPESRYDGPAVPSGRQRRGASPYSDEDEEVHKDSRRKSRKSPSVGRGSRDSSRDRRSPPVSKKRPAHRRSSESDSRSTSPTKRAGDSAVAKSDGKSKKLLSGSESRQDTSTSPPRRRRRSSSSSRSSPSRKRIRRNSKDLIRGEESAVDKTEDSKKGVGSRAASSDRNVGEKPVGEGGDEAAATPTCAILCHRLNELRSVQPLEKRMKSEEHFDSLFDLNNFVSEDPFGDRLRFSAYKQEYFEDLGAAPEVTRRIFTEIGTDASYCIDFEWTPKKTASKKARSDSAGADGKEERSDGAGQVVLYECKSGKLTRIYMFNDPTKLSRPIPSGKAFCYDDVKDTKMWTTVGRYLTKKGLPLGAKLHINDYAGNTNTEESFDG